MKMSFLTKKKKKKLIAPTSGISTDYESIDAEGLDGWKVIDINDEIFDNLEKQEITEKKNQNQRKNII